MSGVAKPKTKPVQAVGDEAEEVEKKPEPQMCEVCGNSYDKTFQIITTRDGNESHHVFDSFECAVHALAPRCVHCGCMILGHGVEADGQMYCCAHCARTLGRRDLRDRAG